VDVATSRPTFFPSPQTFRAWLEAHHEAKQELLVGFYKKGSGKPSITWPEAVDQALCFGWIDGVRRRIDDAAYSIRFSPRRPKSTWSAINIERAKELTRLGLMWPAGRRAFEARSDDRSAIYSYEQRHDPKLDATYARRLRANETAWAFFQSQPPWYRRAATHWVMAAKREATRERRLATLIQDSAQGRTIGPLTRP
jgi:uncharacterized protein YdeI (YjbR/CyaY-like superfamily)